MHPPNTLCVACEGSGIFHAKKCICTFLTNEILTKIIESKKHLRKDKFSTSPDLSYILLLWYWIEDVKYKETDEYELYSLTSYYGDSFKIMVENNKTEKLPQEEHPSESPINEEDREDDSEKDEVEDTSIQGIIYENMECLNCGSVKRKMLRLGTMFFCLKCARMIFKSKNPIKEEKATIRAWLNYNQDLLLEMQNPIKPNIRKNKIHERQ